MKTIVFAIFVGFGWYGAAWSSELWDEKNGFLWGLLASGLFDAAVSFVSGAPKAAWDDLTKGNSGNGFFGRLLNIGFAAVAGYAGYGVLLLGWHHWWTGFWASVLLGATGLGVGFFVIVFSIAHFLFSILPKRFWGKYAKECD